MTHNDDDYQTMRREGMASKRMKVLIVGGGFAGIEALLACATWPAIESR
jgi:NADPH-dependent 2,4-dienoyl-CoA reductase/sulfur reductase-like enzyme